MTHLAGGEGQNRGPRTMTVLTPSYAPDRELCVDLVRSVNRFAGHGVRQLVIVPPRDLPAFSGLAGERTTISSVADYLPAWLVKIPYVNGWVNVRRPVPPVRGWITQQIVKLAAAASDESDIVLLTDSDVVLFRQIDASTFAPGGRVQVFRMPDGVSPSLPRHLQWHAAARRLLGLEPSDRQILPDYIGWPCAWEPSVVRDMLGLVERSTGMHWVSAIGRELHFSEMILYGVYVEEVLSRSSSVSFTSAVRCLNHSEEIRLNVDQLKSLFLTASEEDFAIMISAKSGTPLDVRRAFLRELD